MKTPGLILPLILASIATADVIDKWSFSEADGTALGSALSSRGKPLHVHGGPLVSIKNEQLVFASDGIAGHTFRICEFTDQAISSGTVEFAFEFSSADFSRTALSGGSGNIGFDFRDTKGTLKNPGDDAILGGIRLRFAKGQLLLQSAVQEQGLRYISIATLETDILEEVMRIRVQFDFNRSGKPGSMRVFFKLGEAMEIEALSDGQLPVDASLSGFRIAQQTINGGNNWQVGDFVAVDNFTIQTL